MKKQVVIVEDEAWLAKQYQRSLERAGYETHVVANGPDAITVIDEVVPEAILLDMLLTGGTGLALLNELQSHADLAKIPVVVATNATDMVAKDDLASYGVSQILDKALMHPDDVLTAVKKVAA